MDTKKIILQFDNISFRYKEDGDYILQDLNLEIYKGQWVALIGHNGSGKSTIAKLMAGLASPEKGEVLVNKKSFATDKVSDIRKDIGIVFQNPDSQFVGATVEDDIAFGLENHDFDPKKMKDLILKQLKNVDMLDFLEAQPHNLSGGQKQRVAIAGILAISPEIIIFDESTSMLDPKGIREINQIMHNLHKKHNLTIISITHNMEEVIDADRVVIIEKGKIVSDSTPKDILFNQEKMIQFRLKSPFAVELSKKLNANNIKVDEALRIDEVIRCL